MLVGGSVLEPRQFQQAARHLGTHVALVAVRAGAEAGQSRPRGGDLTVLNVSRLEDLPRTLRVLL